MKRFINNLSTNAKLVLSFGILLILLAVVVTTAYVGLTNIIRSETVLHDVKFKNAIGVQDIRSGLNHIRAEVLHMMLASDSAELEIIEQTIIARNQELDSILVDLLKFDPDADSQSMLVELKTNLAAYRKVMEQEINLIYAGKADQAMQIADGAGAAAFEVTRSNAVSLSDLIEKEVDLQIIADQQAARTNTLLFLSIAGIAVLLAVVMVVILNRTIARPLTNITKVAEQIGGGDLTVTLPDEQRRDEIGALSAAFRQMLATLKRSTSDLSEAVGLLGSSASEILAATSQVASGTAEAATSINETTTTVEEVRQAAQLSSDKAQSVSDTAQRVAQVTQSGQKAVAETSAGMDRIREQMETIAQTVVRLSEQSQSIGGIIASVTDLADQSNLLAVNAAIEAAKAGEQGKGFAVVAQEIRSLAEQSKQATTQVRSILSDVQKATSNAVMATEQGSKAVEAGVKQAEQAGEAIRTLAESSSEAVQTAIQIVASSQQQVVGMDQIGVAMENINQAGAQTASSMRQMEVAAQDLHELGEKLKELVAQFKV